MAVFRWLFMDVYLSEVLSNGSEIRVQDDAVTGLTCCKPGEGFVDLAHGEVLRLGGNIVPCGEIEHRLDRHR